MLVALLSMQRAYDLVPGNYYAVHSQGMEYIDVYFICDDTKDDFRIFGVSGPDGVLSFIDGNYANADTYIAIRHRTKIFESLDFHTTRANEPKFIELQKKYTEKNRRIMEELVKEATLYHVNMQNADNARIIDNGPVVGRYYSIPSNGTFVNAYLICTHARNPNYLLFGRQPPSAIRAYLIANTEGAPDPSIIASRYNRNIYTRTVNKAHEASSPDFMEMRNLLMDRFGFPANDPQRNFDITDDDELTQASPMDNTASASIESDPESKESEVLSKLNDILKKTIEGLDGIRRELNDR
jgi:hypothetical protein